MYKNLKSFAVILRRASRDKNVGGTTLTDTNREVAIVVDKGEVADLSPTKGRKRRENAEVTWTNKKSKVRFLMRMVASLTTHIFCKE